MRTIERSTAFKRDYKREAKRQYRATLDTDLLPILSELANDPPLEPQLRDHELGGAWHGLRECHVKPDLLLIYRKLEAENLQLARLGWHSKLFG